ncbi:MAG: hypothetical protein ACREK4_23405 [Candidatus Rokuibacteriota bacterium]
MPCGRSAVVMCLGILALLPTSAIGQDANCDFSKGAVDIDGCPEIRRELQRQEMQAKDPCNSGSALGQGECAPSPRGG